MLLAKRIVAIKKRTPATFATEAFFLSNKQ